MRCVQPLNVVPAADLVQITLLVASLFFLSFELATVTHGPAKKAANSHGSLERQHGVSFCQLLSNSAAELGQVAVMLWGQSFSPAGREAVPCHPAQPQMGPID